MTAGDNQLTDRATPAVPRQPSAITVPSAQLRALVEALERLGHDVPSLLAAAGLAPGDLADPDARASCEAYGAIVEAARRAKPLKNLALRLAAETPIGSYPLLDYLILTSDSVGEGLRQLSRYFRIIGSPGVYEIREDEDPVRLVVHGGADPFGHEYGLSLCALHLREETEGRFVPVHVSFTHQPEDVSEFERLLGCPVRAGASWDGIAIARDVWGLPLRRRDPILRGVLEKQADDVAAREAGSGQATVEVRRVLASRLVGGDTSIAGVARHLATTARTLQRRLSAEGESYQRVLTRLRREVAEQQIAGSTLSIAEVAYLAGYSEPAAFHRAFRRWSGTTPQAFRQRHRPGR